MTTNLKNANINMIYEDNHIIVCTKPAGIPTQSKRVSMPDMESMLKSYIYSNNQEKREAPYLGIIHRLDQPVSGLLVFAKTPFAARELSRQLQKDGFGKHYRARVDGIPSNPEGTLEDYLVKDGRTNTSRVCTKDTAGAKLARLHYKVVESGPLPLLDILLFTGRHHQIRVQLAHMGCPIAGDTKYNPSWNSAKGWESLQLCAYKLSFVHPKSKKPLTFELPCE